MQEKITFHLSQQFQAGSNFSESLKNELLKYVQAIENLLISYHFVSRGRVLDVVLDEKSFILKGSSGGNFKVDYVVGQFNACADLDFTEKASMKIDFSVDIAKNEITLTGEYIPERGPDEL